MKFSYILVVLAAMCLTTGYFVPVQATDLQIAQTKKEMSKSKDKESKKAKEALEKEQQKLKGKENALQRGKGKKSGLMEKLEEGQKSMKGK